MSEVESPYNFNKFIKVLNQHNIISIFIAAIMSDKLNELTTAFVNLLVMPTINCCVPNAKKMEDITFHVGNNKFRIGRFLMITIKVIIIMYIVYILSKFLKKII